jgi:hypothetical protein
VSNEAGRAQTAEGANSSAAAQAMTAAQTAQAMAGQEQVRATGEEEDLQAAITAETTARQNDTAAANKRIDSIEGQGGYLPAHDFAADTPAMEALLEYYCQTIGPDASGVFTFDNTEPKNSAWTMRDGATRIVMRFSIRPASTIRLTITNGF